MKSSNAIAGRFNKYLNSLTPQHKFPPAINSNWLSIVIFIASLLFNIINFRSVPITIRTRAPKGMPRDEKRMEKKQQRRGKKLSYKPISEDARANIVVEAEEEEVPKKPLIEKKTQPRELNRLS